VVGAHGNSYLGAVDVKHAVLSMLPQDVLNSVPEHCTEQLMVSMLEHLAEQQVLVLCYRCEESVLRTL
jgi:hypothetical protein